MGLCRGKKSKLQLNNTTGIRDLSYNNVTMLAITHSYFFPGLLTIHLWIQLGVAPHFSSTDHTDKIKCALLCLLFHVLIFKLTVPVMNLGHRVLEPNHGHSSALACPSRHASLLCSHGNLQ